MAFECLLVSSDPDILRTINRTLIDFSLSTRICFHWSQAQRAISEGSVDLVVIDFVDEPSLELLRHIWTRAVRQKPTVVGITTSDRSIPGVHIRLRKPVTADSCLKSLKEAYSLMLVDYRHHARCAVMISVTGTDEFNRTVPITIMDIGYGGVGLRLREEAQVGQILSLSIALPGTKRPIHIEARVLWKREFGRTGCEFARVPPVDLNILHDWLKQQIVVKQPAVQLLGS